MLKKLFLIAICVGATISLRAQLEVAQLFTKGQSTTGFGGNLHVGFPVGKGDEISGEIGLYYFAPGQSHMVFVPFLLGYRHTLDHSGAGFYLEPFAGYSASGTDIPKLDAAGNPVTNADGSEVDQTLSGATAGLGVGYILPTPRLPLNFGLRYEHVFVSGNPSPNILAFRISWSVLTSRRLAGK
jgi:outer membrane receptor protein involved in Fe transport